MLTRISYFIVYTCLLYITCTISDVHTHHGLDLQPIRWGTTLNTSVSRIFNLVTLGQCHRKCHVRARCKSLAYHRRRMECMLMNQDGTTATEIRSPGFVYSEKRWWDSVDEARNVSCALCTDVCRVNGTNTCTVSGCDAPTFLDYNSYIQGNMQDIGSTVRHVCAYNTNIYGVSECLHTGQWSLTALTCPLPPIECVFLPTVQGGTFRTPHGIQEGTSGYAHCDHVTDRVFTDHVTCQSSGLWNVMKLYCWSLVKEDFHGLQKRFVSTISGKCWHNDVNGDQKVSVRYQPNDEYVRFQLRYHWEDDGDGYYTLMNNNDLVCDGYGTDMTSLHTESCPDQKNTEFYFYRQSGSDSAYFGIDWEPVGSDLDYLIVARGSDRIVGVDENELVSTVDNEPNGDARFNLVD